MSITYIIDQDITLSKAQTLVNTVNCVGAMDKGVALAFKQRFPLMYEMYCWDCEQRKYQPGYVYFWKQSRSQQIANCAVKNHWRNLSQIEWVIRILDILRNHILDGDITSLAIPKLGCGNGGLDWLRVNALIIEFFYDLNIPIQIYVSTGDSQQDPTNYPF